MDPSNENPALPTGHPFPNLQPLGFYWSTKALLNDYLQASALFLGKGIVTVSPKSIFSDETRVWCVRGGQSYDGQDLEQLAIEIKGLP